MKILLVNDLKPESLNGVSVSVSTLAENFKKMGHDVRILTLNESLKSNYPDSVTYRIGSLPTGIYPKVRWTLQHRGKAFRDIIEWNPDIIHTNCEFSTYYMIFRIIKHCKVRPKWVHTFHTDYRYYVGALTKVKPFTDGILPVYLRKTMNKPDVIIVPSHKSKKYFYDAGIVPRNTKINIVPCGINISMDDVDDDRVAELKKTLNLENKKVIISLGRVSREKNIDELMSYFAEFSKTHDNYHLLICGLGPRVNHLKIKASSLKIADKVTFCIDIPHEQVPNYLRLADVFASSSMSETQGMTYYEALICGIPVIASDSECLRGVVRPGENGDFYFDYRSFERAVLNSENLKKDESILGFECSGKDFANRVIELYK